MTRGTTGPIPESIRREFFALAWKTAEHGHRRTTRRHAIAVLWLTACGLRFGELAALKLSDFSPAALTAFIARSKEGESHVLTVTRRLVVVTKDWRRGLPVSSEYLLANDTGGKLETNAFNRDACGFFIKRFPGLRLSSHCFRDTASQIAMQQTGDVRRVQAFLGHRSVRTTERYLAKQKSPAFCLEIPGDAPTYQTEPIPKSTPARQVNQVDSAHSTGRHSYQSDRESIPRVRNEPYR